MPETLTDSQRDLMAAVIAEESDAGLAQLFTEILSTPLKPAGRVLARTCWWEMAERGWMPPEAVKSVAETVKSTEPSLPLVRGGA